MADLFDDLPPFPPPRRNRRRAAAAGPGPGARRAAPRGAAPARRPAAPRRLDEVVGQDHLLGPDAPLGRMLAEGNLGSIVFWGPPGVGKTTIARLLADATDLAFVQVSAIFTGVADLKKIFEAARLRRQNGRGTLLFVDEIHRFNKAQQDAFLPLMEDGTIVLVGATTENPSFELNAALLSRARVLTLQPPRRGRARAPRSPAPRPSSATPCRSPPTARDALIAHRRRRRPGAPQPRRADRRRPRRRSTPPRSPSA